MPAIMTSGMVSRSNLPDRPRRRGGFGRGNSVAEGSSGTDKVHRPSLAAHDPPKCGRFGDKIMRQLNIFRARSDGKPVPTFPDRALLQDAFCTATGQITDR